ncbi:kelch-like protein 2 [Episyrphus balteatus]|uniref:kelch-like protein 2 n=1 Tax=Episyrphus balteatus TaxID=286459 RepID=UPI002485BFEA|nr:kelch-like protein 2 [Episyrphus balteatus]
MSSLQFNSIARSASVESQEKPKIVKCPNYANNFCEKLFSLFEKHDLTDVCIIGSDEVRFNAHKNVLAVGSDFFAAMFASPLKESVTNEVRIQELNGEILKSILDFIYTGTIELKSKTVPEIFSAARFFQMESLVLVCQQFMVQELDPSNCLGIALFAKQHDLNDLYETAFQFACTHFEKVSKMEEFLNLSEDQVVMMISNEELCVTSEKNVFLSLIKWIEHDKQNREQFTFKLLSHVHYWSLSPDFIKQNRSKLSNENKIFDMICTWLEWHCTPSNSGLKSRKCCNDKLVVICSDKMHTYNPEQNIWEIKSLPGFPTFDKVVEINEKLIIQLNGTLKCFDLKTNRLSDLPRFDTPISSFGLAVMRNELYVVGGATIENVPDVYGRNHQQRTTWSGRVQKFNFASGEWQCVKSLSKPLSNPVISCVGRYMHVKGYEEFIASFDSETNEWTWTHFPFKGLSKFGFAIVNEKLYFVGQQQGSAISCVYEHANGKWRKHEMRLALTSPRCISWNNRIIAYGACDGYNLILEYNPETKFWKDLPLLNYISNNVYEVINVQYNQYK